MAKLRQGEFVFPNTWGGVRKGAGPKRKRKRAGVSHRRREGLDPQHPVHVTMHVLDGLPSMRRRKVLRELMYVFFEARERNGMRIVHWTACRNHFHLIVEAESAAALARGMNGLNTRLARALNRVWGRRGRVFDDRYFADALTNPARVRSALAYVLHNARRHGERIISKVDYYGTGLWFDGWKEGPLPGADRYLRPCVPPSRWLLRTGWKRRGLITRLDISQATPEPE